MLTLSVPVQTCEECPNVRLDREGEYITVDVEKGMREGQVRATLCKDDRSSSPGAHLPIRADL